MRFGQALRSLPSYWRCLHYSVKTKPVILKIKGKLLTLILWDTPLLPTQEVDSTKSWELSFALFKYHCRASLVAQWLRICLPRQGTQVRALVWEGPTCRGAANPVCHNYWACTLEPASHNYWARRATTSEGCAPTAHAPQQGKPTQGEATARRSPRTTAKSSPSSPQLEKACTAKRRPNAAKNK